MYQIVMRFKSGREYNFKCKSFDVHSNPFNELILFDYRGGVGECPVYYNPKDVESIAVVNEEKEKDEIVVVSNCYRPTRKRI